MSCYCYTRKQTVQAVLDGAFGVADLSDDQIQRLQGLPFSFRYVDAKQIRRTHEEWGHAGFKLDCGGFHFDNSQSAEMIAKALTKEV